MDRRCAGRFERAGHQAPPGSTAKLVGLDGATLAIGAGTISHEETWRGAVLLLDP